MNERLYDMYGKWSIAKTTVPINSQIQLFEKQWQWISGLSVANDWSNHFAPDWKCQVVSSFALFGSGARASSFYRLELQGAGLLHIPPVFLEDQMSWDLIRWLGGQPICQQLLHFSAGKEQLKSP